MNRLTARKVSHSGPAVGSGEYERGEQPLLVELGCERRYAEVVTAKTDTHVRRP
jgi:hypothetical protein